MIDKTLVLQHLARMRVVAETINDPRSDILFQILLFMVVEQVFQRPQIDDMRGITPGHTEFVGERGQIIHRTDIWQILRTKNFIAYDMVVGREVIALLCCFVYAAQVLGESPLTQPAGRSRCDVERNVQGAGQVVRPVLDHIEAGGKVIIILSWHRLSG